LPVFQYKAVSKQGEVKNGSLSATSRQDAINKIQSMGLIPISADSASVTGSTRIKQGRLFQRKKLGASDVSDLTRQLAILVGAGLSLDRSLQIIRQASTLPLLTEMLEDIQNDIRQGQPLSSALASYPKLFSDFYINFIRSAELSGNLGESLEDLSRYLEKSMALREQILTAMIYPAILVAVTLLSLSIIVVYVLPEFAQLFEDMDANLPASTAFVLGVSNTVRDYGLFILLAIFGLVLYVRNRRNDEIWRTNWDRRLLSMTLVADLIKKIEMARLSRSLGTLLKGGVPLLRALKIARDSLQNRIMAGRLDEVASSLVEGSGLASPLMETGVFPEFALQMIQVGEETGELDRMLIKVADIYENEVATATQRLLSVLEPMLIIGLGITIGGIIMSILVAILSINELPI